MHIGDSAWQDAMHDLTPVRDALLLEPGVERTKVRKLGIGCHEAAACIRGTFFSTRGPFVPDPVSPGYTNSGSNR